MGLSLNVSVLWTYVFCYRLAQDKGANENEARYTFLFICPDQTTNRLIFLYFCKCIILTKLACKQLLMAFVL